MRLAHKLAALFIAGVGSIAIAAEPTAKLPVAWGEANEGIQLSVAAEPSVIKPGGKLMLYLWAKNLTSQELKFDAWPPTTDDSTLIVVDPDGKEKSFQFWADQTIDLLVLSPGERELRSFDATQYIGEWVFDPKGPPGRQELIPKKVLRGVYRISWKLHNTFSNIAEVRVK